MSGVEVDDNRGESFNTIKCSNSSAVIDCHIHEIPDVKFTALLDTGSQVSLVRSSFLTERVFSNVKRKNLTLRTVNGQKMSVTECVDLCVEVGGMSYFHEFIVSKELIYPMILGLDFISKNRIQLEFTSNA